MYEKECWNRGGRRSRHTLLRFRSVGGNLCFPLSKDHLAHSIIVTSMWSEGARTPQDVPRSLLCTADLLASTLNSPCRFEYPSSVNPSSYPIPIPMPMPMPMPVHVLLSLRPDPLRFQKVSGRLTTAMGHQNDQ